MNECVRQAEAFLLDCNAKMTITHLGKEINKLWNEKLYRDTYRATITTPLGTMWVKFWNSIEATRWGNQPTEYDILACLQKYDVGTFEQFIREFGYDYEDPNSKRIYKAVVKEYESICRCFTKEQIEAMSEIW